MSVAPMIHPLFAGAALAAAIPAVAQPLAAATHDTRTPEAIALQKGLEDVCLPMIAGRKAAAVEQGSGLRDEQGDLFIPVTGKERVSVLAPDAANPTVCTLTVSYHATPDRPLLALVNAWALSHQLAPVKVRAPSKGPSLERWTSSWTGSGPAGATEIVFNEEKTLSGGPALGDLDEATLLVSRQGKPAA